MKKFMKSKSLIYNICALIGSQAVLSLCIADGLYQVKEGDTLSDILFQLSEGRIYGKSGNLRKVAEGNRNIHNADRIYPGQRIRIHDLIEGTVQANSSQMPDKEHSLRQPATAQAATAQPATAQESPAPSPSEGERFSGYFRVTPLLGFSQINGIDTSNGSKGELNSGTNFGFDFAWIQSWSETVQTYFSGKVQRENYLPSNSSVTLSDSSQTISRVGVGVN